ncbi:MAG: hypothetical protein NTX72_01135 [Candidatus Uhrbacteria bacterium]|nr:hypothetical protein [Candidatus Uhrbacteria bacterium]
MEIALMILFILIGLGFLVWKPEWMINISLALIVCAVVYGLVWCIGTAWPPASHGFSFMVRHAAEILVVTLVGFCALGSIK